MKDVEEKIIQMEFDNRQFESNVNTSILSLEKLKNSLDFGGAAQGLETIDHTAGQMDFSVLNTAVNSVVGGFNSLEVIAITALSNITNSAVNAGKKILNSLTIEPITTGFNEYELKMDSIQTIMASTGESVDTVNKYLKELNEYSDKTIYSFADMTNNIGKFTNAGVKLDDAVAAIKGVSNVAAVSGANTNEASRAMYNFAQALSAGSVKLIDWKSIENANMATVEFKNQLIQTAVSLGTVTQTADGMYKTLKGNAFDATHNFNEVLQDQWMTSEVLVETLKDYADETTEIGQKAYAAAQDVKTFTQFMDTLKEAAQSGWAETWELIVGDIDEAKAVFKELSDIIGGIISDSANSRNALLGGALNSKWDEFAESAADAGISVNELKEQIVDVAKTNGVEVDKMIDSAGSYEESLKEGWLTADIVAEAIGKMADETDNASAKSEKAAENFINLKRSFSNSLYDMDSVMSQFTSVMSSSNSEVVAAFDALGIATSENTDTIKESLDNQVDTYRSSLNKELDAVKDKNDKEIDDFKKLQDEETEALTKSLDDEMDALTKSLDDEMDALEDAHDDKLKLIDDEYTEKLKLLDEDKYNQIKTIEDEIKAIDAKTEAEEKEAKEKENNQRRLELQKKVTDASDYESRKAAQEALDEFDKKLAQEKVAEERKQRKAELNEKKKNINDQYALDKKNLQTITEEKKKEENDQYEIAKENLKDIQSEEKKALKEVHDEKKENLKDEHEIKLKNLKAEKDAEIDAIKEVNDASLKGFKSEIDAQKNALNDTPVMRDTNTVFQETIEALDKIENQEEKARLATVIFGDTLGTIGNTTNANSSEMRNFAAQVKTTYTPANKLVGLLTQTSGRDLLIESFRNILLSIIDISQAVSDAWVNIMPEFDSEDLYNVIKSFDDFTKKIKEFTGGLNNGDGKTNNFKSTLRGLFSVIDIGLQIFSASFKAVKKLTVVFADVGNTAVGVTGSIGEWLVSLDRSLRKNDIFSKVLGKIADVIISLSDGIKEFGKIISEVFTSIVKYLQPVSDKITGAINAIKDSIKSLGKSDTDGLSSTVDNVKNKVEPLEKTVGAFEKVMSKLASAFKKVSPILLTIGTALKNAFVNVFGIITDGIGNIDVEKVANLINSGSLAALTAGIFSFVKGIKSGMKPVTGVIDSVKEILGGLKDTLEAYQNNIKAKTLLTIAGAVGVLTVSLLVLSTIEPDKVTNGLTAIAGLLGEVMGSMAIFSKIAGNSSSSSLAKLSTSLIMLSVAVLLLTSAVKKLSDLNDDELTGGLIGIGVLIGELTVAAKILSTTSSKLIKGAGGLIIFSTAICILVSAVQRLGELDTDKLIKGLIGVGVIMGELAAFMKLTNSSDMKIGEGVGILALSAAIVILSKAVKAFAELDTGAMIQGLIGVGVVLSELVGFLKLTGDSKKVLSTAVGLTVLGAAMLIFADAVKQFGTMSISELVKGIAGLGISLGVIVAALNLMPKNVAGIGAGLLIVSLAIKIMANALNDLGGMSWEQLSVGLVALAGGLGIMALAVNAMTNALPGAAAVFVVSAAIAVLTPALISLGNMSWESIGKGLLVLAGAFAVFGVAALVLTPIIPAMLSLGGAIALLGVSVLACGVGVLAFSAGLTALAASGAGAAAAIVLIVTALCGLVPIIADALAEGLIALIVIIGESGSLLCDAIAQLIIALCDAILISIPPLLEVLTAVIDAVLNLLLEYIPIIADVALQLLIGVFDAIDKNLGQLIDSAVNVIVTFVDGMADQTKKITDCLFYFFITVINELADSIRENTPSLMDAIANLIDSLIGAFLDILDGSIDIIKNAGEKIMDSGLVKGIEDKFEDFKSKIKEIPSLVVDGVTDGIEKIKEVGSDIVEGLKSGITGSIENIKECAAELGESALNGIKDFLGIHSPSTEFADVGKFADMGFINGLKSMLPDIADQASDIGETATDTLSDSFSKISDCIDTDMDIQPTIRPVLDLSDVNAGAKTINAMMSNRYAMSVGSSFDEARSVSNSDLSDEPRGNSSTFTFNQYNNSPKALSRKEIRRDTIEGLQLANAMR